MTDRPRAAPELPEHCRTLSGVRVRFGETDLMGIVHHARYLYYFEAGRVEYCRRRGVDTAAWAAQGVQLPVVESGLRYRRPARFDDLLHLETRLALLTRVTLRFDYRLVRPARLDADSGGPAPADELLTTGFTLLACVGPSGAPRRLPEDVARCLAGPETHPRPIDAL